MTKKRFMQSRHYCIDKVKKRQTEYWDDVISWLNELSTENQQLKEENKMLRIELDTHKHPLWSTREAERKIDELTNLLNDEIKKNARLNELKK